MARPVFTLPIYGNNCPVVAVSCYCQSWVDFVLLPSTDDDALWSRKETRLILESLTKPTVPFRPEKGKKRNVTQIVSSSFGTKKGFVEQEWAYE